MIGKAIGFGWIFSGAVALWTLTIFWIGLRPETVVRKVFRAPPTAVEIRAKPVQVPLIELPPPLPLPDKLDLTVLPGVAPVSRPAAKRRGKTD